MNAYILHICRACRVLAAVGILLGALLLAFAFVLSPEVIATVRSIGLNWASGYLILVGAMYVLIGSQAPLAARLSGPNVNVFAGIPDVARPTAYGVVGSAVIAFFIAIALAEYRLVDKSLGEVAILGTFFVGAFGTIFCGSWSALRSAENTE